MNLYMWTDISALEDAFPGHVIVHADSLEDAIELAVDKCRRVWSPDLAEELEEELLLKEALCFDESFAYLIFGSA